MTGPTTNQTGQPSGAPREAQDRYSALFERSLDCVYLLDFDGRFIDANPAALELLGYTREEIPSADLSMLIDPEQMGLARQRMEELRTLGHTQKTAEFKLRRRDGTYVFVESKASIVLRDGRPYAIQGIARDITDRKRVEQALQESEELFRNLTENMHAAVGVVQGVGFVYANRYMAQMLGYTVEEILSVSFPQLVHPSQRAKMIELARRRQMGEPVPNHYEFIAITKQGEDRWIDFSVTRSLYKGKPAIIGTGFDITDRKRMEEALKLNETRLRQIIDLVPHFIFAKDREGRILLANKAQADAYGMTVEQLVGKTHAELHADDAELQQMLRDDREVIDSGKPKRIREETYLRSDGERRVLDTLKMPYVASGTNTPAVVGVAVDITERKRAEERLKNYTRGMKLLADTATRLLTAEDPREALRGVFDELADHLGLDVYLNYLVSEGGDRLRLHAHRGLDEAAVRQLGSVGFGQTLCGTVALEKRSLVVENVQGSTEPKVLPVREMGVRAYACHPLLANSHVIGTLSFCSRQRDHFSAEELELMRAVSHQAAMALERQRLTAELERRAAELTEANHAKDHFLAVLSHELRTPLTPVVAAVSMLQHQLRDPASRETLEMIRRNVEMEARLIDDLLDVTRITRGKIELEKRPVAIETVVRRVVEVCMPDIEARGLHFGVDLGPCAACVVEADATRLQQVLWNLLKNAIKFTPHGGCVGVFGRPAGPGQMSIEVRDSGIGIETEMLPRLFGAFEQAERSITRQFGGLGLGLAISKALVEMHGGTIEADSPGKGKGASFRITLPLFAAASGTDEIARDSGQAAVGEALPQSPLRILLVEDHGDTARVMRQLLMMEGHQVQTAGDVATALDLAGRHSFDLIISDLGLPDASGLDLMREVRARYPALRGIALSGYGQDEDVRQSREAGFTEHLTKPVDADNLLATVQRVVPEPIPR